MDKNKILIFPTDTVYGIGTHFLNHEGVKKIYEIKGRDFNKPLQILVSSLDQVKDFVELSEEAYKLAQAYWPGALTIIVSANEKFYQLTGDKTIGLRMPNHPKAIQILNQYGPMKTTSVNQSGEPPMNDYQAIYDKYHHLVDEIYTNEEPMSEVSSTVVNLAKNPYEIIRIGNISVEDIKKTLSK